MLKFKAKPFTARDHLGWNSRCGREVRKKKEHRETVVKVAHGINESRVSFSNDMVESISRFSCLFRPGSIALKTTCIGNIATAKRSRYLLFEDLLLSELL